MLTIRQFASIPGGADLTALYRARVGDYPKFFKMDTACKLGFLLAEQLADEPRFTPREDRAVLMFSTCGSLCNDRHYEETVREFPSPSLFVYTLPNIITGEIAIRNKYEGETSAYVLERFDPETFVALVEQAFQDAVTESAVCGWVDVRADDDFTAFAFLVERDGTGMELNKETIYGTVNQ
jgi:3-oxoacyl-[acyl-carrier-protein] synthase-1